MNNIKEINQWIDTYINLEKYCVKEIDSICVNLLHKKELVISLGIWMYNSLEIDNKFINLYDLELYTQFSYFIFFTYYNFLSDLMNLHLNINPGISPITRFKTMCCCFIDEIMIG
jgi:hypothetical protein